MYVYLDPISEIGGTVVCIRALSSGGHVPLAPRLRWAYIGWPILGSNVEGDPDPSEASTPTSVRRMDDTAMQTQDIQRTYARLRYARTRDDVHLHCVPPPKLQEGSDLVSAGSAGRIRPVRDVVYTIAMINRPTSIAQGTTT